MMKIGLIRMEWNGMLSCFQFFSWTKTRNGTELTMKTPCIFYIYRCVHGKLCMRAIDWYEMASLCSCQNGWISNIGAKHANPIDANCLSTLKIERKTATKHWSDFFKIILVGTFWPSLHFVRTQIRFAEKFWTKKKHWRSKKKIVRKNWKCKT